MDRKLPVKWAELSSQERVMSFDEVSLGYTEEQVLKEAARCLQCEDPQCSKGCPVGIDIKSFIYHVTQREYNKAYNIIRARNDFPSICGRVCPSEYQCRKSCILTKKNSPFADEKAINIHLIERFVGDYGRKNKIPKNIKVTEKYKNKKVAVIGSGPAGLCAAGELASSGVKVVIFEALHKPGGVLVYGIPPFRLPRDVLAHEIKTLQALGVEIKTDIVAGRAVLLDEFFADGFDAVFLGLGAGIPGFLGVPGENLANIYSANEFLTRVNLMSAHKFPEYRTPINVGRHVVIVGGGNTAMDAARTAVRIQKSKGYEINVKIVYRRTEKELPARRFEIGHAYEEGIIFKFLTLPAEFEGLDGRVSKIKCLECRLGEPDESGRMRPEKIPGSEFIMPCDTAVIAVGLGANKVLTSVTPSIKTDRWGDIIIDPNTMATSVKNVFAGGDIVGGEGTVIEAMGMAKRAAVSILRSFDDK
ncbi:MAG: NADPH-dependent glutamate synthase [Candidatus Omnitrophica bacterium]|nr:NADPH-dependent glutamate synthase [Candidatus Omnitrophota bacterium]MDD5441304.1 NADPH-dependent glutamate synthase [Candidatus Omnitrophota bacterium]